MSRKIKVKSNNLTKISQNNIIKQIKSYIWQKWLDRPFNPFFLSLFKDGITKKYFNKIGIKDVECEAFIYQNRDWYESEDVWNRMDKKLKKYLSKHNIFDITKKLDSFYLAKKKSIKQLVKEDKNITAKLKELYEILTSITSYIWLAHGLEHYYNNKLNELVPKYIKGDIDLFIGDASFPKKKTAHALMEEAIIKKVNPVVIAEKFGWLRVRDGFDDPFTEKDIRKIKVNKAKSYKKVNIPKPLRKLFFEVQELVYFRTRRTDVLYELVFLSRPILIEAAKKYNLKFKDLKKYTIHSLIAGKPKTIKDPFTCINYKGNIAYLDGILFKEKEIKKIFEIKGFIAQKGKVKGIAKIVKNVSELDKVKNGDILIAQMTFPSFIMAMRRASAFVTDEGGITCHAAIVAREMRKPCIIGTKVATKVLKDGNLVEVDASNGVVKIIE